MRTIILSDLHLGSGGAIDLLRRPELREVLWAEIQGADLVVLLGDAIELTPTFTKVATTREEKIYDINKLLSR